MRNQFYLWSIELMRPEDGCNRWVNLPGKWPEKVKCSPWGWPAKFMLRLRGFRRSFCQEWGFKLMLKSLIRGGISGGLEKKGGKWVIVITLAFALNGNFTPSLQWQLDFPFWSLCGSASDGNRAGAFESELARKSCSCFRRDSVQNCFSIQLWHRPATSPLEATPK